MITTEIQEILKLNPTQAWLMYDGLRMEARHRIRLTARAPTCYALVKERVGLKGSKESVLQQYRKLLWQIGVLNEKNDRLGKLE